MNEQKEFAPITLVSSGFYNLALNFKYRRIPFHKSLFDLTVLIADTRFACREIMKLL